MGLELDWEAWSRQRYADLEKTELAATGRRERALADAEAMADWHEADEARWAAEEARARGEFFDEQAYRHSLRHSEGHDLLVHRFYVDRLSAD